MQVKTIDAKIFNVPEPVVQQSALSFLAEELQIPTHNHDLLPQETNLDPVNQAPKVGEFEPNEEDIELTMEELAFLRGVLTDYIWDIKSVDEEDEDALMAEQVLEKLI